MPVEQTRTLYTLAELRDLNDRPAHEQDDTIDSRAYQNAMDKVQQWSWETNGDDLTTEVENWIAPEIFGKAGITFAIDAPEWDADQGWFRLPKRARFDAEKFLRAARAYWSGVDYRGPEFRKPLDGVNQIAASLKSRRKLDLRSKAARAIRDFGLGFAEYGPHELDFTYLYEVSQEWRDLLNDFVMELEGHAASCLTKELDYLNSEARLLEMADNNEYLFDRMGRPA